METSLRMKKPFNPKKKNLLTELSNMRSYPSFTKIGLDQIVWEKTKLEIYFLPVDEIIKDPKSWCKLVLYHISHFYYAETRKKRDNINPERTGQALIGLLLTISDPTVLISNDEFNQSVLEAGIIPDYRQLKNEDVELLNSHHYKDFKKKMGKSDFSKATQNMKVPLVMMCVIFLTIVKSLNAQNEEGWIKNRLKTFSGSVGDKKIYDFWEKRRPYTDYLFMFNNFMTSNFHLRKSAFLVILEVVNETVEVKAMRDVIQLMRGTEMHHLVLINKFIMVKYMELQSYPPLRDIRSLWKLALNRLSQETAQDVMFIKLLYSKEYTAELSRNNFLIAAVVATTCARYENPTFENYYMDSGEKAKTISKDVELYLARRQKLAQVRFGESSYAYMGPTEQNLYFKKVLEDYEKVENNSDDEEEEPHNPDEIRKIFHLNTSNNQ